MNPVDVKTYTTAEAKAEWDGARETKRRMFLARIDQRDSDMAKKAWDEFSASERKLVHGALNEDFISPMWYINTKCERVNRVYIQTVQKSPEQLADEEGERHWKSMPHEERFQTLLHNGIGQDAEQGQFSAWGNLSPDLRDRLIHYFADKETASEVATRSLSVSVLRPTKRHQLELF